jgi:hypothetical protein
MLCSGLKEHFFKNNDERVAYLMTFFLILILMILNFLNSANTVTPSVLFVGGRKQFVIENNFFK